MSAVDAELARVLVETGELELALSWAEGEARELYATALIVLAEPGLVTDAEYAKACVLRDQFEVMFAGFLAITATGEEA